MSSLRREPQPELFRTKKAGGGEWVGEAKEEPSHESKSLLPPSRQCRVGDILNVAVDGGCRAVDVPIAIEFGRQLGDTFLASH